MCTHNSNSQSTPNPPVIFLHGWGMNKNVWQSTLSGLTDKLSQPVLALDLPGYGSNHDYKGGYELSDLSLWLKQQTEEYARVILVGWSLGGLVAQQFAIDYPERIAQLNIVGSTPKFMADDNWQGIKPEVLSTFAEQLLQNHQQTVERFLAIQAMGSRTAREDIKALKALIIAAPQPDFNALAKGLEILSNADLRTDLAHIDCPFYALFGKLDSLVPHRGIPEIALCNENAVIKTLAKSSHAPFISHPAEFSDWLLSTLN